MHDNLILKIFLNKKQRVDSNKIRKLSKYPNIKEYLENKYKDSFSITETINRIHYNIKVHPKCPVCGKYVAYAGISNGVIRFKETCSQECANKYKKHERTVQTCLNKYGVRNGGSSSQARQKIKETCLKKYGVDHPWKSSSIHSKCLDTIKLKYNVNSTFMLDGSKETIKEKFRVDNVMKLQEIKDHIKETCIDKYGVDHPWKNKEIRKKCQDTFKLHTGYNSPIQFPGMAQKVFEIRKINGTTNTSKPEEYIYDVLIKIFGENDIKRQYKDEMRYPYFCDFYIVSQDLFIEYNGFQGHGKHPFNINSKEDNDIVEEWINRYKNGHPMYKSMIDTWTKKDPQKRNVAKTNKLRYCEFFNIEDFDFWISSSVRNLEFTNETLNNEYKNIVSHEGKLSLNNSKYNKIILQFQQNNIYKIEQNLYDDLYIRYKLIENRKKYTNKEITKQVLLKGFKISGIYYGYSMFNPMLAKWFVQNYHLENMICYDPTGGWGHRLLGIAPFVKKYIYNDLSEHTLEGCKNIAKFCNLNNIDFYNQDAKSFNPNEDYDFMFTCPPYYDGKRNIEEYECDGFDSQEEYYDFLMSLYNKYKNKESCKIFGLVIREDMIPNEIKDDVKESYCLTKNYKTHYARKTKKKYDEYLFIFNKSL